MDDLANALHDRAKYMDMPHDRVLLERAAYEIKRLKAGNASMGQVLNAAREREAELRAERDALLYSERLHSEALGAAVKEDEELRAERDALRAP